ncbi:MAG TPA: hypothetical protein PLK34_02685 [Candidatus Pacearchaeota archaeon]|nr:hypothetical protein [Candidatus Pacearchaeota archaeon]
MKYKFPSLSAELKLMKEKPLPYLYEINLHKTKVLIFGLRHTQNPNHTQFELITKKIRDFSPEKVLFEFPDSAQNLFYSKDKEKAIKRIGEIRIISDILPKKVKRIPADNPQKTLLNSGLGNSEDIEILEVLIKSSLICKREGIPIKEFIQEELKKRNKLALFNKTSNYVKKLTGMNLDSVKDAQKIMPTPIDKYCRLNDIMRKFSLKRDEGMINRLIEELKTSKRIIFFVGRNHALRWEKILRNLSKE